ncbi:hypothetical protein SPO3716 [Ruegeria pomeroyi DSS-3]|uniref:HPt domain-containing protein n=1 Tax=Ruegeria pomeroyi (strain ATCC 700808 / DSM 15171 / DSS-3) TaxID=246200 RepID=Q5LM48_RUEPO|nr:hypothetical protein SPO3716 [Ruegeria pomeroyi DSS-3]
MVVEVITLVQSESVRLDPDRLGGLYRQLGDAGAEDVVCRAIEELAVRLTNCERLWRARDWTALRKCARSLIAISEQIGMVALARVARQVTDAIDNGDYVATSAVLYRLIRVGEKSLTEVWDQQDLSI